MKYRFLTGKKVYSYSSYKPTISDNGKLLLMVNSLKRLRYEQDTIGVKYDVYNKEGEIVKSYPFHNKNEYIFKPCVYHVFNNGNILVQIGQTDYNEIELYLYKQDSIIDMFYENTLDAYVRIGATFDIFDEQQLIFIELYAKTKETSYPRKKILMFYDYNGILLDIYVAPFSIKIMPPIATSSNIKVKFTDLEKNTTSEIIFDLKTKKYIYELQKNNK